MAGDRCLGGASGLPSRLTGHCCPFENQHFSMQWMADMQVKVGKIMNKGFVNFAHCLQNIFHYMLLLAIWDPESLPLILRRTRYQEGTIWRYQEGIAWRYQECTACNPASVSNVASQLVVTSVRRSCCIITNPAQPMSIKTSIYPYMTT